MSDHESFEDRLRAIADQVSESVRRLSDVDFDEFAERYGLDAERTRAFADLAGQWLGGRPPAGQPAPPAPDDDTDPSAMSAELGPDPEQTAGRPVQRPGPHPLDLPTGLQGLALSALDSGRWTVKPGRGQLAGTGEGPPPSDASDVVSDLRARDWISADGALTLTGRYALARWCRTAEEPARLPTEPEVPPV